MCNGHMIKATGEWSDLGPSLKNEPNFVPDLRWELLPQFLTSPLPGDLAYNSPQYQSSRPPLGPIPS